MKFDEKDVESVKETAKAAGEKTKQMAEVGMAKLKEVDWKQKGNEVKEKAIDGFEKLKTKEGRESLKAMAINSAIAAKDKVVAVWKSGTKGKVAICSAIGILLLIGGLGDDEGAGPDGSYSSPDGIDTSVRYSKSPAMKGVEAKPRGPVIKGFYLGMTIADFCAVYNGRYAATAKGFSCGAGKYELAVNGYNDTSKVPDEKMEKIKELIAKYYPGVKVFYEDGRLYADGYVYIDDKKDSGLFFTSLFGHGFIRIFNGGVHCSLDNDCLVKEITFYDMKTIFNVVDIDKPEFMGMIIDKYDLDLANVNAGLDSKQEYDLWEGWQESLTDVYEYVDRSEGFKLSIDSNGRLVMSTIQKYGDVDL